MLKRISIARDNWQTVSSRFAGGWMKMRRNEMGSKAINRMANNRANDVSNSEAARDNNRDNNKAVSKVVEHKTQASHVPCNEIVRNGLTQIRWDRSAEMIGAITGSYLLKFASEFVKRRIFVNSGVERQPEARASSIKLLID